MKSIEQKVIKFADNYKLLQNGEKILIALSGGPDSIFALYFFKKFSKRFGITLAAAHLNHMLRGKQAEKDEEFCKRTCADIGIEYYSEKYDVAGFAKQNKISVEEAARKVRYDFLLRIAKNYRFDKIVTAHTMDDNAETVLMNLIKGTGLQGIAGIPVQRNNIIRPVLALTKDEIVSYLENYKIEYRVDKSNKDLKYERNFIRHKILPLIKKNLNPSVEQNIFNTSLVFKKASDSLRKLKDEFLVKFVRFGKDYVVIELSGLQAENESLLGEVLKDIVVNHFKKEFEFKDYIKVESLLEKPVGRKVILTSNLEALKDREKIYICPKQNSHGLHLIDVKAGEVKEITGKKISINYIEKEKIKFENNRNHEFISADELDSNFVVRKWQTGDKFFPLGMKKHKNVSDFLLDEKIPAFIKKDQFVLLNRNQIVWIIGLRIDNRFKITEKTKKVIELWIK